MSRSRNIPGQFSVNERSDLRSSHLDRGESQDTETTDQERGLAEILPTYPAVQRSLEDETAKHTAAQRPAGGQVDHHHHHRPLPVAVIRQLIHQIVERGVDAESSKPRGEEDDLNSFALQTRSVEEWRNVLLGFVLILDLLLLGL